MATTLILPFTAALVRETTAMMGLLETAARVAPMGVPVLLQGGLESTCRELLARFLHERSARARGPFVAVDCAAIPEHLLESELFGHARGAFAGGAERQPGCLERSCTGTLFLNDIEDVPLWLQARMERAFAEHAVQPVDSESRVPIDVRTVVGTSCELRDEVALGRFREDLYYRLATVVLELPPVPTSEPDVQLLSDGLTEVSIVEAGARWAGDAREAPVLTVSRRLPEQGAWFRAALWRSVVRSARGGPPVHDRRRRARGASATRSEGPSDVPRIMRLVELERRHIERILSLADGDLSRAAELLGIDEAALQRKLRAHGLQPKAGPAGSPPDDHPSPREGGRTRDRES